MTRELIIDGQHVDIAPDTEITLEYVSNILTGATGGISLPKSYTVKLPKTARNARILDDPGQPSHASTQVRRFLSARYYRNGVDLIGPARAYILDTTADAYEIALVWNALPALQTLSESTATLQGLPDLPVLTWIGSNGKTPDYGTEVDGALFARYDAGLGEKTYPEVPTSTHPAMRALSLINKIMANAGVQYQISSERVRATLSSMYILAAPSHRPNREMEDLSGCWCSNVRVGSSAAEGTFLAFDVTRAGWDAPATGTDVPGTIPVQGAERVHISLRLRAASSASVSSSARVLVLSSDGSELANVKFVQNGSGSYDAVADLELDVESWSAVRLSSSGVPVGTTFTTSASGYTPLEIWRVHPTIDIDNDNRFPMAENLPNIKQWDFVKACMVLSGAVPVIQSGELLIMGYDEAFDTASAYDWTHKVTATENVAQRLSDWARENLIKFEDDDTQKLEQDPTAVLRTADETVAQSRELYTLPFAASQFSTVQHYTFDDEGEIEDVEITPRIMMRQDDTLIFAPELSGAGLADTYSQLQRIIYTPVILTATIRLNEIDLTAIDMRHPVYLGQYGQYYAILKIQTSATDLCKVELLQLP